jgi:hypothetical protein
MLTGGCHCGAIRYQADGAALTHALCHCTDCRRHAGAPMVGWTMYRLDAVKVLQGTPKVYSSSEHGRRHFCPDCGTGLFYTNTVVLPGIIDIQTHPSGRTHRLDGAGPRAAGVRALSAAQVATRFGDGRSARWRERFLSFLSRTPVRATRTSCQELPTVEYRRNAPRRRQQSRQRPGVTFASQPHRLSP